MDVGSLIATLRGVGQYLEEKGKANTQLQLNQVITALTDLSVRNSELTVENINLKEKLKRSLSYIEDKGVVWKKTDTNFTQPYCPVCFSKDKVIPLQKTSSGKPKDASWWSCPDKNCEADFNPWDYREPDTSGVVNAYNW